MRKKNLLFILWVALAILGMNLTSCTDYEEGPSASAPVLSYDGTVLDFIDHTTDYNGMTFDSLSYIINTIPGLRDTLNRSGQDYTLFLASDESVARALTTLNRFRSDYGLGRNLSLKDFMIEPFTVIDTVITGTIVLDTTVVNRNYDYRGKLDTLVMRYAFAQKITSATAAGNLYYSLGERQMKIDYAFHDASGLANAGTPYMQLIDLRNSKQEALWVKADVKVYDIFCSNGVIHILSPEHEFGFNDIITDFKDYGNERKEE